MERVKHVIESNKEILYFLIGQESKEAGLMQKERRFKKNMGSNMNMLED